MPYKYEKGKGRKSFLLMRRITRMLLWGLLVFIVISAVREMNSGNSVSRTAVKQAVLKISDKEGVK